MKISRKLDKISHNIADYLLLGLSLITVFGAVIYYFYALNLGSIIITLGLSSLVFWLLHNHLFKGSPSLEISINIIEKKSQKHYLKYWPYLLYFLVYIINIYFLYSSRSDKALISPWQVVNSNFFVTYTISSLILIFILLRSHFSASTKLISLSAHYFLSFSVAAIVYKIAYGYDPFIHQATMELIDKYGLVTPKPLYYLGEYSLIIILHKISGLSIYFLNKFLVPILAAIYLPYASYRLARFNGASASRWLVPLFLLTLTFSPFILTTPQNLSYLFLILTISFGLTKTKPLWSLILASATLAIHPLTGIPAICWWLLIFLNKNSGFLKKRSQKYLRTLIFIFSALSLPIALFISGGNDLKKISWNLYYIIEPLQNLFSKLNTAGQENWLLNIVYFFDYNYNFWLIVILVFSLILFYRSRHRKNLQSLIFINIALLFAFLISSQIIFVDLINYEQNNFSERLLVIILIFFLPIILFGVQKFIDLILTQNRLTKIIWLCLGLTLLTSSLYISYPRFDRYFNSRGYSTSINDLKAVNEIAANSKTSYIVLANQQVSAAALIELGFNNYYQTSQGPIYFYPIPTGGTLYQFYLDMVYKNPSRETMASARALAGVNESYLIVNKYWFQSDRVINAAKVSANSWTSINNEVFIFKYLP